jgi:hypothetical protein
VAWIDQTLSDDEFLAFMDVDRVWEAYIRRDEQWITLFEKTEQRIGDSFGPDQRRATKVRAIVFGMVEGTQAPTVDQIEQEAREGALIPYRNRYRFELAHMESVPTRFLSSSFREHLIPLLQVSRRSFRGRHAPDLAALVLRLAKALSLEEQKEELFGYVSQGRQVVRSVEWQEAFDRGRRRHEPRSSGFLLEMNREILSHWAESRGVDLWAYLAIERTTDCHASEDEMDWRLHREVFSLGSLAMSETSR